MVGERVILGLCERPQDLEIVLLVDRVASYVELGYDFLQVDVSVHVVPIQIFLLEMIVDEVLLLLFPKNAPEGCLLLESCFGLEVELLLTPSLQSCNLLLFSVGASILEGPHHQIAQPALLSSFNTLMLFRKSTLHHHILERIQFFHLIISCQLFRMLLIEFPLNSIPACSRYQILATLPVAC